MDASARTQIAIVGAGAAGIMLARALVRPPVPLDVVLVDPAPAGGPAFRGDEALLLNTPASDMSLEPRSPSGFVDWLNIYRRRPQGWRGGDFAPRALYGDYLRHSLEGLTGRTPGLGVTRVKPSRALAAERTDGGWRLRLPGRETLHAEALVLATGAARPRPLLFHGRDEIEAFVQDDPWDEAALRRLPLKAEILLAGAGLTALDVATLTWRRDPEARITLVSRRGLLPRVWAEGPGPALKPPYPSTARELYAKLRGAAEFVEGEPALRPGVFVGLREAAPTLWTNFSSEERAMFLRHFRRYWEVERHRLPPAQAEVVAAALKDGRLRIVRGRIAEGKALRSGQVARVALLGAQGPQALTVNRVINCTGPESDPFRSRNALLLDLLAQGAAVADPHGLGLQVDDGGAVLDGREQATAGLYALGAPTQGRVFASTSVPEIRAQAQALADRLHERFKPKRPPLSLVRTEAPGHARGR